MTAADGRRQLLREVGGEASEQFGTVTVDVAPS